MQYPLNGGSMEHPPPPLYTKGRSEYLMQLSVNIGFIVTQKGLGFVLIIREVNNRLTFAHPVNYFAHPVNLSCPLPKIAHPVNYLNAHRKMGTTIIKNQQFKPNFWQN